MELFKTTVCFLILAWKILGLGAYLEEELREIALKGALGWDSQDTRSCGPDRRRTSIVLE